MVLWSEKHYGCNPKNVWSKCLDAGGMAVRILQRLQIDDINVFVRYINSNACHLITISPRLPCLYWAEPVEHRMRSGSERDLWLQKVSSFPLNGKHMQLQRFECLLCNWKLFILLCVDNWITRFSFACRSHNTRADVSRVMWLLNLSGLVQWVISCPALFPVITFF